MVKILIVEDTLDSRQLLELTFRKEGYEVSAFGSGSEALEHVREINPDLAVLDIMLSEEMDGFQLCKEIRTIMDPKPLAILFLTSLSDMASKVRGLEEGANDYLTKPYQREELMARVHALLKIKDLQEKNITMERLATVAQMVAALHHEINNPLATIMGNAELLLHRLPEQDEANRKRAKTIIEESERIRTLLKKSSMIKQVHSVDYPGGGKMVDLQASAQDESQSISEKS